MGVKEMKMTKTDKKRVKNRKKMDMIWLKLDEKVKKKLFDRIREGIKW
jgi:hypothetical protein